MRASRSCLIAAILGLVSVAPFATSETVGVRILSKYLDDSVIITGQNGRITHISRPDQRRFQFPPSQAPYEVVVPGADINRMYPGKLTAWWEAGGIVLVNSVDIEDYVVGVVIGEMGWGSQEGLRAQAVLARTWAWRHREEGAAFSFGDLANHQVYNALGPFTERVRDAISATEDLILTYNNEPIEAVYHAACAERTYSAAEIWNSTPHPYLRAATLPSALDEHGRQSWSVTLEKRAVDRALGQVPGADSYRVQRRGGQLGVAMGNRWLGVDEFRLRIDRHFGWNTIRSNAFSIHDQEDTLVFSGEGHGHLVGLCQTEAMTLAEQGWRFHDILSLFYPGTALESIP